MSQNFYQDLLDFTKEMAKYDERQVIVTKPTIPSIDVLNLRVTLIEEEVQETISAMYELHEGHNSTDETIAEVADGIADSIVVLIGTAIAYGIPLDKVWNEVHRSNMDKVTIPCPMCKDGIGVAFCVGCGKTRRIARNDIKKREDGKILKPDGWQPPNIKRIIEEASK